MDYDYCARFSAMGFKNKCCDAAMNHQVGDKGQKTFFPHINQHSDFRLYYIIRNLKVMIRRYPDYARKNNYKRQVRARIVQRLLFCGGAGDFISGAALAARALKDSKNM